MDRSMTSQIRLSDTPTSLNALIEDFISRFSSPAAHVQLYHFERNAADRSCEQRVAIYTDNQQYMLHAKWNGIGAGYLGCIARSRKPRAGEDHSRGSDLSDGPFTYETWFRILSDIVSYELVTISKAARPVPDGHLFPSDLAAQQPQPVS